MERYTDKQLQDEVDKRQLVQQAKQSRDWLRALNIIIITAAIGQGVIFWKWVGTELHAQDKRIANTENWIGNHKELVERETKLLDFQITEKLRAKADAQYTLILTEIAQLKDEIADLRLAINNRGHTSSN